MASKQADSAAAAKAKEAADFALTEAKKHLAILEALEEANKPSETPTTPSEDEPAETPAEDEPSESPADSGETETIVIPAGKTETKATGKSKRNFAANRRKPE
ncbi:hypothetical protein OKX59_05970 [Lactobacillus delbrueckii subsp. indicus]|uniref:hypothetical protein n=1 Tax=Lactobacillus delbrueckii TaxID=1584 RepID=UPI002222A863|nr:hypothetical protein [Lactobacillus delbrueckii]UYX12132.1 hypothetical protein OJ966_06305 [Lactobacillus delbrueckii]UYY83942.1 hypothetical protein OKX59_05970 [Lactobacillus delbrueckii subsp. indicus]